MVFEIAMNLLVICDVERAFGHESHTVAHCKARIFFAWVRVRYQSAIYRLRTPPVPFHLLVRFLVPAMIYR